MAVSPNSKMIQNAKRFMSSSKDSIDMEAYPILRIDELSNASDEILDRSLKDLPRLVEKMEYEDRKNLVKKENPLVKYARKQFEAMEEEVTKRNALKRVERMLQGTEEVKPKSYDNILTSRKSARPRSSSSINIATPSKPPTSPILSHSSKETYGGDGSNSQERLTIARTPTCPERWPVLAVTLDAVDLNP